MCIIKVSWLCLALYHQCAMHAIKYTLVASDSLFGNSRIIIYLPILTYMLTHDHALHVTCGYNIVHVFACLIADSSDSILGPPVHGLWQVTRVVVREWGGRQ